MDIVKTVADAIAEIPGKPSPQEIARVAIEEYQKALWPPLFDREYRFAPEPRWHHANAITAHIMHLIGRHLCDHGEANGPKEVSRELFEAVYESGAYIVTDADRSTAGLPQRDRHGLTREELHILELKRTEALLAPRPPLIVPRSLGAGQS